MVVQIDTVIVMMGKMLYRFQAIITIKSNRYSVQSLPGECINAINYTCVTV